MKKKYLLIAVTALVGLSAGILGYSQLNNDNLAHLSENQEKEISAKEWAKQLAAIKAAKHNKKGYFKTLEGPTYFKYMDDIRTEEGEKYPSYTAGYQQLELEKSLSTTRTARTEAFTFEERGPGNVAGRSRAVLIDVRDTSKRTWFMGTAGGGIWKTADAGATWQDKSGNMASLAITSLAQSPSSPTIMYATTGETPFSGNGINGGGVFKSTDGGDTWNRLDSTIPRVTDFLQATRVIVSPTNPNLVLVTSAYNPFSSKGSDPTSKFTSYVFRSTDGGNSWIPTHRDSQLLQQIIAEPGNFNNMYVVGGQVGNPTLLRSTDAGLTWKVTNMTSIAGVEDTEGNGVGRSELAISPTNPAIVYASVHIQGGKARLLRSSDRGISWRIIEENGSQKNQDYLGGQGGYDNAIAVDPTDENTVYWGGVDLWKAKMDLTTTRRGSRQFVGAELENMDFLTFTTVTGFTLWNGRLQSNNPAKAVSIEIRFGPGKTQKAHRFVAGGGNVGPAIPAAQYIYTDYVDVPFEIWDIENNRQLMFSFRDQKNDGKFTFTERSESDTELLNTREYMYIHAIPYDATAPSSLLTKPAGHEEEQIYFLWPFLTAGQKFDATATSTLRLNYGSVTYQNSAITRVSNAYGGNTGVNNVSKLHPDHHMLAYATDSRLISVNDGGLAYSDDAGNSWLEVDNLLTNNIVTSQYYKVDRHPTQNRYVGGMQDNGSWVSPLNPTRSSDYKEASGGDGMEAVWHATNPDLVLTTSQYNTVYRSTNGGNSFVVSSTGITETGDGGAAPFVTRLGYSSLAPNVVFAVGASGVYKSINFGQNWTSKTITNTLWSFNVSTTSIYPSLADPKIVWAGGGMSATRTMFISNDAGETFTALPNPINIGVCSGFTTNPENRNEAYMLFGQAGVGKVWRTKDLGQTWEDISGFGQNITSNKGFPDVVPFSMVVVGDTLLVGTEIGIVASYNNATSWELIPNFPKVAVFSLIVKERDGQLVIGTHGRGAWSSDLGIKYDRVTGILNPTNAISLKVYPNPTQDRVRFELPKITGTYDIRVYTITGQEVLRTSNKGGGSVELNIQKFVGGTYLLKAINGNKLYVQKVVLQK